MVNSAKKRLWLPAMGHGPVALAQTMDNGSHQADVFLTDGVAVWEVFDGPKHPGCGRLRLVASGESSSLDQAKADALAMVTASAGSGVTH